MSCRGQEAGGCALSWRPGLLYPPPGTLPFTDEESEEQGAETTGPEPHGVSAKGTLGSDLCPCVAEIPVQD